MLLIGTMNLTRTKSTGEFFCPNCGVLRDYRRRSRRPFLTIYFIPTVPIGAAEEFVQCSTCKTNSPLAAIEVDEKTFRQTQEMQFRYDALYCATMVATADGGISEPEIEVLLNIGNCLVPGGVSREQLGAACSSIRLNRIPPRNHIASVSRAWTQPQKRLTLQACFLAATADSELPEVKLKLLAWLKEQFGLSEPEYQNAIDDAIEAGIAVYPLSGDVS